jgi:hypothetical protein
MEFFRKGEAAPFEKREARHEYSVYEGVSRFTIAEAAPAGGMANFQALMTRMADPKLSSAERDQLMKQIEKAQVQLQAEMKKMTDPAYLRALEDQKKKFGCERIELRMEAGRVNGEMRCSDIVGTRIVVTGSVEFLGR